VPVTDGMLVGFACLTRGLREQRHTDADRLSSEPSDRL